MIMKDMEIPGEKLMVITTLKSYEILGYSGNPKYEDVRTVRTWNFEGPYFQTKPWGVITSKTGGVGPWTHWFNRGPSQVRASGAWPTEKPQQILMAKWIGLKMRAF
jgi:hypothetical protein